MKRMIFTALAVVFALGAASAQRVEVNGENYNWRQRDLANRSYTNLSYVSQKMIEPATGLTVATSDWGAAFSRGRTFVMHRAPVARMLYFGLDATWGDVNYAQYSRFMDVLDAKVHHAQVAMGIGPSVHLLPVARLGVHAYFRYMPTYSAFTNNDFDYVMGGFGSMFTTGGAVSYGVISLGAEARWGTAKYGNLIGDDGEDIDDLGLSAKLKTSGVRAYVSFRF